MSELIPEIREQLKILIFDLDGVITSEKRYWNIARLTVWEVIASHECLGLQDYFAFAGDLAKQGQNIIDNNFIRELKSRAINSNWDLTFFVVCLHMIGIFSQLDAAAKTESLSILQANDVPLLARLQALGKVLQARSLKLISDNTQAAIAQFWQETKQLSGASVLDYMPEFAEKTLGAKLSLFAWKEEMWQLCYNNFQDWYHGKKPGSLPEEETVLDLASIKSALEKLYNSGRYILAIATGRPRSEVLQPMQDLGLLQYFDPDRIVTYDEVLAAEKVCRDRDIKLGKPHPFIVIKAIYPSLNLNNIEELPSAEHRYAAYIGDAASDVVAAKRAGCIAIGVLTGFTETETLKALGCDLILNSVLELPLALEI